MLKANKQAIEAMKATDPILIDVKPAYEVIEGLEKNLFLHAGPPIAFSDMCEPMKGAVYCAAMNEGLAKTAEEAHEMAMKGQLKFSPCHEYDTVGPMTGLTSWSMPVWVVEDRNSGKRSYANISEGSGVGLRFGEYSTKTLDRLKWMREVLGPILSKALAYHGPVDLGPIMAQGLAMGDELHMRNHATTSLILKALSGAIGHVAGEHTEEILNFIAVGNDQFFLNLAMAASKLVSMNGMGFEGSTVVTVLARNGVEVGVKISGLPDQWFTAPAPHIKGLYFPGRSEADANPDLGDSAIMEVAGFGGCAMIAAPAIIKFLGAKNVDIAHETTHAMYRISLSENAKYTLPIYNFRGIPCGLDAIKIVEQQSTPILNTAIASNKAGVGMVGAGMSTLPVEPFEAALLALGEHLGL